MRAICFNSLLSSSEIPLNCFVSGLQKSIIVQISFGSTSCVRSVITMSAYSLTKWLHFSGLGSLLQATWKKCSISSFDFRVPMSSSRYCMKTLQNEHSASSSTCSVLTTSTCSVFTTYVGYSGISFVTERKYIYSHTKTI